MGLAGTNPSAADNNELTDGEYTQLERYLNWLAEPHFVTSAGNKLTIDLKQYFAGYNQQPVFTLENSIQPQEGKMKLNKKGILTISLNKKAADCLIDIKVKATDKDQVASCNVLSTSLLPGYRPGRNARLVGGSKRRK